MCSSSAVARPAAPARASWPGGRAGGDRRSRAVSAGQAVRRVDLGADLGCAGARAARIRRAGSGSGTAATSATAARSGPSAATAGSSAASSSTTSPAPQRRRSAPGRLGPGHRARQRRPLVGRRPARALSGGRRRDALSRRAPGRAAAAERAGRRPGARVPRRSARRSRARRAGRDGEPELLLHDDLRGYSWNVPKTDWLNVGSGTVEPHEVRAAWQKARAHFSAAGHVPAESAAELDAMKGHTYYLFDPAHLEGAARRARRTKAGGRAPVRRQPGARAAAHRRGDPARGALGPPRRRGDPGRRTRELPGAPRRAPGDRGLPPRLPPARGGRRARAGARAITARAGQRNGNGTTASRARASAAGPSPAASPGCSRARGCRRRAWSTRGWRLPSDGRTIVVRHAGP